MVGAELVVPVSIADIGVPDARLGPEHFRRIEAQTNVLEHFGLGFVVVEAANRAEAADRQAIRVGNAGALRAADVGNVDDAEWIGPAAKDAAQRDGVKDFDIPIPFEVAVAAERSAADAGAAAKASSRALGIAEAGRSAGVELVMGEFLASQHTDQQRAELLRNGDIEVQTH